MNYEDDLTIEHLSSTHKSKSQFDLVNYAITLAEDMIKSGRGPRVKTKSENKASQVIAEIQTGKDLLNGIEIEENEE